MTGPDSQRSSSAPPAKGNGHQPEYGPNLELRYSEELVPRFHAFLHRTVPPSADVLVVSKGDRALLAVEGRRTAHFPQRGDGVYLGYYPQESQAAIEHLEALREKGAMFLAFPATAFWWLEHYDGLRRRLESRYRLIARDDEVGALYALFEPGSQGRQKARPNHNVQQTRSAVAPRPKLGGLDKDVADEVRALFDQEYYAAQGGPALASAEEALEHYLAAGYKQALDPHPLFDSRWYLKHHPEVAAEGVNPLLHFVRHGAPGQLDPNPFFDTSYYYEQAGGSGAFRGSALVHYLQRASTNQSYHPNPLFRDGFYLRTYNDARALSTPLEHYLRVGWREGRLISHVHQEMVNNLAKSSSAGLVRGRWKRGTVLFRADGEHRPDAADIVAVADEMASRFHIDAIIVASTRSIVADRRPTAARLIVLEDYQLAADVQRPSAQRLLTKALTTTQPLFAVSELPELLETLRDDGVGTYYLLPGPRDLPDCNVLAQAFAHATRVIVPTSESFVAAARALGEFPANVASRPPDAEDYTESLLRLGELDFGLEPDLRMSRRPATHHSSRRLVIPCSDWGVSGVNASLEALGLELGRRGWDVEVLFTRDERWVGQSAHDGAHMPRLPYRYVHRRRTGIEGMWEALIGELERNAPALVLTSYDFLANAVIPALTEQVGVAMWVQADDGDYYEQVYRLGRYCDAVVCVARLIRDKVVALNPALSDRVRIIPNSSVWRDDVVRSRPRRRGVLRIVYSGRLVQYQKRVLDFVDLAKSLDRTSVAYQITLIGAFPATGAGKESFELAAAEHLASGRIRLAGRMTREQIFAELDTSDFFVLLSDFEGLPLALVEAMARGCVPVAAEMDSGVPEIVRNGENGLVVPGRDYDHWVRMIVEAFNDRRRLARMSQAARKTVERRFTVEQVANQFETLLSRIAEAAVTGEARRPPALHWGLERSWTGDVLPPPSIVRPAAVNIGGLQ
jgi:glycosyltransferase involved in cell wall biosynthesis